MRLSHYSMCLSIASDNGGVKAVLARFIRKRSQATFRGHEMDRSDGTERTCEIGIEPSAAAIAFRRRRRAGAEGDQEGRRGSRGDPLRLSGRGPMVRLAPGLADYVRRELDTEKSSSGIVGTLPVGSRPQHVGRPRHFNVQAAIAKGGGGGAVDRVWRQSCEADGRSRVFIAICAWSLRG